MMPLRDDQYISLSPTDSPAEDAEMDTVDGQQVGKGFTQLPGDTPRTPGPKGVNFQQFCDQLQTDLPGDSRGRRSFDTRTRFVAGDPVQDSARLHHWSMKSLVRSDVPTGS